MSRILKAVKTVNAPGGGAVTINTYKDDLVLYHHGVKGQQWGVRRYQNKDGSLTAEGKQRYSPDVIAERQAEAKQLRKSKQKDQAKLIEKDLKQISKELDTIDKNWARQTVKQLMKKGNERPTSAKAKVDARIGAYTALWAGATAAAFITGSRWGLPRAAKRAGLSLAGATAHLPTQFIAGRNKAYTQYDTAMLNQKFSTLTSPTGRSVSFVESKAFSPGFGGARTRVQVGSDVPQNNQPQPKNDKKRKR